MTKSFFLEYMETLKNYYKYEDELAELNVNIWERDEVQSLISGYVDLLCVLCKDYPYPKDRYQLTDIEYYIYDLEWGRKWKPGTITDEFGNDVPMGTLDDLWDELVRRHPDIVDIKAKEENE